MQNSLNNLMDLAFPGVNHDYITTLSVTARSTVFKHASEVAKCHINADKRLLSEKIVAIKSSDFRSIFLQPTRYSFSDQNENVSITYWPIAERLSENHLSNDLWSEVGKLLAKLHSSPLDKTQKNPTELFSIFSQVNEKILDCFKKVKDSPVLERYLATIRRAWYRILTHKNFHVVLKNMRLRQRVWTHGDFHLGQIVFVKDNVRTKAMFIDVDTMCVSIPEWDLARPAALFASGILPPDAWQSFIESYGKNRANYEFSQEELWSNLDIPAKVMVVKLATSAVNRALQTREDLDDSEIQLIETCNAISRVS